jgi:hypothetical protein
MPTVKTMNGTSLLVQIGDGASPENFTHDCLINTSRGIQFSADTNEFIVPDCINVEDPAWKEVTKDGLSAAVNGAGMANTPSIKAWFDWWRGKDTKNCRIRVNVDGADGGGYWQGAFHLTSFEVTGERNAKAENTVSLMSSGEVVWVDAT